ncbi:MAG: nucleotide exchange factor GrpE, partial [Planctomycetes bacterium]|nr:nucleotide exchange factor GrpE [Planctomycetota bacterium]
MTPKKENPKAPKPKPAENQPAPAETPDETAGQAGELETLKDKLQRLGADYQNYQKRAQKQITQADQFARWEMAKSLLPVLDNFEHTLANDQETADLTAILKGITIVYDHLLNILKAQGLEVIQVDPADPFDPSLHEAMLRQESVHQPPNSIIEQLAPGYTMNGRTLRPAKVSVATAGQAESDQNP